MLRAVVIAVLVTTGCRPEDALSRARHEAAELHAKAARTALTIDPARAVVAARLAQQADPLDPAWGDLLLRARAHHALALGLELPKERWAEAEYESEAGEKRDPEFSHVYRAVFCLVTLVRGDAPTAERDLAPVVAKHPDWATGQALLARALDANQKPDEAYAAYLRALELDTSARAPYLPAARLMLARGEGTRAVKTLEAALAHGESIGVRLALAEAYDAVSRLPDATAQLERAVAVEPNYAASRLNLAEHLTREARFAEAEAQYTAAARLGAEPLATRGLGLVAWAQRDAEKAARAFERVLQLAPQDPTTLFYGAEATEALKKPADAARLYERYVSAAAALPAEADRVATARERIARLSRR